MGYSRDETDIVKMEKLKLFGLTTTVLYCWMIGASGDA